MVPALERVNLVPEVVNQSVLLRLLFSCLLLLLYHRNCFTLMFLLLLKPFLKLLSLPLLVYALTMLPLDRLDAVPKRFLLG